MARDCPDRQRGASWRNNDMGGRTAGRIGGGDAVDREMEVRILISPNMAQILTRYSNSCKSLAEVLPTDLLRASRPALAATEMRSPGSVALLEDLRLGVLATMILTTREVHRLPGGIAEAATRTITAVATAATAAVMAATATTAKVTADLPVLLRHGSNRLPELRVGMLDILATATMEPLPEWALLLALLLLLAALLHLLRVLPQVWETSTPSFSSTPEQHLLHHLPQAMLPLPLPVTSLHPHLLVPR